MNIVQFWSPISVVIVLLAFLLCHTITTVSLMRFLRQSYSYADCRYSQYSYLEASQVKKTSRRHHRVRTRKMHQHRQSSNLCEVVLVPQSAAGYVNGQQTTDNGQRFLDSRLPDNMLLFLGQIDSNTFCYFWRYLLWGNTHLYCNTNYFRLQEQPLSRVFTMKSATNFSLIQNIV